MRFVASSRSAGRRVVFSQSRRYTDRAPGARTSQNSGLFKHALGREGRSSADHSHDADAMKKHALESLTDLRKVEHQRDVFNPNPLGGMGISTKHNSGRAHVGGLSSSSHFSVTLPRPPSSVHLLMANATLSQYTSALFPPAPPFHRYPNSAMTSKSVDDTIGAVVDVIFPIIGSADDESSLLLSTLHVFFNTLLPLLPSSGANSQAVSLESFDVLLAYGWSSLAQQSASIQPADFSPQHLLNAWDVIRRAAHRNLGLFHDVSETHAGLAVRTLMNSFLTMFVHRESGRICVARADNRNTINELFAAFTRRSTPKSPRDELFRVLIDELVVALYILPIAASRKDSASVEQLAAELASMLEKTDIFTYQGQFSQLGVAVHRSVSQRPSLFAPMSASFSFADVVRLQLGGHQGGHSSSAPSGEHFLSSPHTACLLGAGIRAAAFSVFLPMAHRYCGFIESIRAQNSAGVSAKDLDWEAIDVSAQTCGSNEGGARSHEFDSFALIRFAAKGGILIDLAPTILASSRLLHAVVGLFFGKRPTSIFVSDLPFSALIPPDSLCPLASIICKAGSGAYGALHSLTLDEVRAVLLKAVLCGVVPEYVADTRNTCGVFVTNLFSIGDRVPSLTSARVMRDAVVGESVVPLTLCIPKGDFTPAEPSRFNPQSHVVDGVQKERISEQIDAADVLELDSSDFDEYTPRGQESKGNAAKPTRTDGDIPHAIRRMVEYNASLGDVEVAERVRIILRKASWCSGGVTLSQALPLSALAKLLLWNSYARTSTRNLRKFLSFFPEHFDIFIVGEKDVWVRMSPNAPSGGHIVPPLPSEIPVIPHGTPHPRASPAPPSSGLKQGDLSVFSRVVVALRPLIHAQLLSAFALSQPFTVRGSGVSMFDIPVDLHSRIGEEDRSCSRTAVGFSVRELSDMIGSNPKRLRATLLSLPPTMVALVPMLSVATSPNSDESVTVLEQRDENAIVILGQHFYSLEYLRFLLIPDVVCESALTTGLRVWRSLHKIENDSVTPRSSCTWQSIAGRKWWCSSVSEESILKFAPQFIFERFVAPFVSFRLDTASFAPTMKLVSTLLHQQIGKMPLLPAMRPETVACIDARSFESILGWRDHGVKRSQSGSVPPCSLEKRLRFSNFCAFMDKFVNNPHTAVDLDAISSGKVARSLDPRRSVFTLRSDAGGFVVCIVEQQFPGGDSNTSDIVLRPAAVAQPSPLDTAMAELFKKRVDRRLSALPNIPLASVVEAARGSRDLPAASSKPAMREGSVTIHNQSHAGLPRFETLVDVIAPPKAPQSGLAPPPIPAVSGAPFYYGGVLSFSRLLSEAKRRCIPHRRYFDPLIQFIADTSFAIFEVVLPALDIQNSGGANRMERFAQISGYANKCQHKVGSIESFVSHWDGLFVELMGKPSDRAEGYIREFRGRVTRRMLYSRFFRPFLSDVTALSDGKEVSSPSTKGLAPPPPIGKGGGRSSMSPVSPAQQGISLDEVAAACQYEYLFLTRFGPLSALLLDFGEFRLNPVEDQGPNLSRGDCFVSPQASAAPHHQDYRAVFVPPPAEADANLPSSTSELEAARCLHTFVRGLHQLNKTLPLDASFCVVPLDFLTKHIGTMKSAVLQTLFASVVVLLPTAGRVLTPYVEAASNSSNLPEPSFPMIRQFIEGLVALLPLQVQFVTGKAGPTGLRVQLHANLCVPWLHYFSCFLRPILAPVAWQALGGHLRTDCSVSLSEMEMALSWRGAVKPFPLLPLAKSPANAGATIPLYPLLAQTSLARFSADRPLLQLGGVRFAEGGSAACVIDLTKASPAIAPEIALAPEAQLSSYKTASVGHVHTELCGTRRHLYCGEQLTLIANGFDPCRVRVFRLMYASLLADGTTMTAAGAGVALNAPSLTTLRRLDEAGPLVAMAERKPHSAGASVPDASSSQATLATSSAFDTPVEDFARMDSFYRKQQWYAERNAGLMSESARRRLLFGDASLQEGFGGPLNAFIGSDEEFEASLLRQQSFAAHQVHGRSSPGVLVEDGGLNGAALEVDDTLSDAFLETVIGFTIPLVECLLDTIPQSPISLSELSRVLGVPPSPLYWSLRAIRRLQHQLVGRGGACMGNASRLEVQVTFDKCDALVWVATS